jgi:putative RNA 2'-phosphotransferase
MSDGKMFPKLSILSSPAQQTERQPMLGQASRWLIKALRHQPQMLNLPGKPMNLEEGGWASVDHVLQALARNKYSVTRAELDWIVSSSNKQRFGISEDGSKIRANQGHSVDVDMQFVAVQPPSILWHGTAIQFCPAIRAAGLSKMARQHVHMSADTDTATKVGSRHGEVVVLKIDAERMHADGLAFFCSENGVWLTDHVPQQYISGFP